MKVDRVNSILIIFASWVSLPSVIASGKRSYGESCSVGFSSIFSSEKEERSCDSEQGLICAVGRCSCPIGRVFESSASVFGKPADGNDPGCFRAAGAPCFSGSSSGQNCVFNGHCEFGFCICDPGYRARRGHCIKTSSSDDDSSEDGGNKGNTQSKFPSFADIFNNIQNYFQNGRPGSSSSGGSRAPEDSKPIINADEFDFSGFPITRPAHDNFDSYPIARPMPDDFPSNYPITRPFNDDNSNFYHTRPLHEELLRPDSGKVLFPDE